MAFAGLEQLPHHGRQTTGAVIFFAQIFPRRLHVHQERHVVTDLFPILDCQFHANMPGDGIDMDRRIGRAANGRIGDDGVLESLAGKDVSGLEVFMHQGDRAHAGFIGDLPTLAVRRRDRSAAGQRHAKRLGQRIHGRCGAHGVAMADRRRRRRHDVEEFLVADLAGGVVFARLPDDGAGAGAFALPPAVQHRPAGQHDGRDVNAGRSHNAGRRGLVAAGGEDDAVERVAVQNFDQAEISEIAVERGGRPLAGFLDRMHREFKGDAAGRRDAGAHPRSQFEMVAIAGRQVRAGLRDADDRLAGRQFLQRQAVIEITLEIQRCHARIVGIVEPKLRAQFAPARLHLLRHDLLGHS